VLTTLALLAKVGFAKKVDVYLLGFSGGQGDLFYRTCDKKPLQGSGF